MGSVLSASATDAIPSLALALYNDVLYLKASRGGAAAQYLKEAPITVISYNDCRSRWGIFFNPIRSSHICVFNSGTYGACNGDSGGPLFSPDYDTGKTTVTGVTSFGRSGCDTSYPSVYTRISSYTSWITNTMNSGLVDFDSLKEQFMKKSLEQCLSLKAEGASLHGKFKNCRIIRWALALQEFRFRIEPVQGKLNVFADCLSRSRSDQLVV
nr:hypothetical protein BaRGS_019817 [Batillaria attramentaria]